MMIQLENIGDELIKEIQKRMVSKGLNDTQGASESLRREATDTTLDILGSEVITWLNRGRSPGKFAPPEPIQKWVVSKLGVSPEEAPGIAFVINRKMKEEGTEIFKDPSKGLELDEVVELGTKLITQQIGRDFLLKLSSELNSNLRRI